MAPGRRVAVRARPRGVDDAVMKQSDDEHPCEGWCQCQCGNHTCGCACSAGSEPADCAPEMDWDAQYPVPAGGWGSLQA
jgi:hypothetical protein